MIKKINNISFILILIVISVALISVFIIEHVLNYEPCKLCIYQRIPYFLSIFLIIKIIFIKKYEKITLLILSLVFFSSAALAFYHFGIEQSFFSESLACETEDLSKIISKEQLLEQLKQNNYAEAIELMKLLVPEYSSEPNFFPQPSDASLTNQSLLI